MLLLLLLPGDYNSLLFFWGAGEAAPRRQLIALAAASSYEYLANEPFKVRKRDGSINLVATATLS